MSTKDGKHNPNLIYFGAGFWPTPVAADYLRARGIARDTESPNETGLAVYFNRRPSDDEMRAIHDCLSKVPATCPFCAKPTYVLPCSHCGEPDVPEGF